jgi:hypothetical protein
VNIIEAISDPAIFGPAFRNKDTWQAWFAFLATLFGLELTPEQLALYQQCTGRKLAPVTRAVEAWLVCGRRAGKSFILALVAVFLACFFDWTPYLAPGERGTIMIIAADRRQARTIMRYVKGLLRSVPMLARTIEAERTESIDLSNRITIEVHTASFRTVRGYSIVCALLDELAFWQGEDSSNPDFEIVTAIRPAMATIPNAMLLCASSPYARKGALWEAYHRYFGQDGPVPILVWQASTRTMNPTVPQSFIDAEYEKDPAAAEAEFNAQFRTDLEAYVSREAVEACVEWRVHERAPLQGINYTGFVDTSGGGADSFALAIAHKEGEFGVHDVMREVRPPLSPEAVITEFADLLKTYRITKVIGDRYGGQFPVEHFQKNGIKYEPSKDPKGALYLNFLPMLNSGKVKLLGSKRLVGQLVGLERNTARGGKDSIDHARGGHDDVANAVAGALLAATAKKPTMRVGTIDFAKTGKVTWHDAEPREHSRIRFVTITEQEDLRQRGLL